VEVTRPARNGSKTWLMKTFNDWEYLDDHLSRSKAVLVTGAGFSTDARDYRGRPLPSIRELQNELWALCFPDRVIEEDASVGDLFQCALMRHRTALAEMLQDRLRVNPTSLPDYYATWFNLPWHRIYTLNIDDLDEAANRAFPLRRSLLSVSAVSSSAEPAAHDSLCSIHLNGTLADDPEHLTFSWPQYGDRLTSIDRYFAELTGAWMSQPVVFVGTRLEEPSLWQHLKMRLPTTAGPSAGRGCRSFLVSPNVSMAKQELLSDFGVEWIRMTSKDFAHQVLRHLDSASC
jgi:hypothetical protein